MEVHQLWCVEEMTNLDQKGVFICLKVAFMVKMSA
jgi:hypothetical protein